MEYGNMNWIQLKQAYLDKNSRYNNLPTDELGGIEANELAAEIHEINKVIKSIGDVLLRRDSEVATCGNKNCLKGGYSPTL